MYQWAQQERGNTSGSCTNENAKVDMWQTGLNIIRNEYRKCRSKADIAEREQIDMVRAHVEKRNNDEIVKKVGEIRIEKNRGRGQVKNKWMEKV